MSGEDRAQEFAALGELAEAFTRLVELFTHQHARSLSASDLIVFATRSMPHAQHAGLTVWRHGRTETVAGSSPLPQRLDEIRARTGEGPALDLLEVNDLVISGDLAADPRWPRFGATVVDELGVRSVLGYRLYLGPDHRAALVFLSDWPHAFDELAVSIGAIFAAYCSLTLFTELVLGDRLPPSRASQVHSEIGVAVGILLASERLSSAQAYQRLHRASRELGRSVHDVARQLVREQEAANGTGGA